MSQLLKYWLSDGQIDGIYDGATDELLLAQVIPGDPTFGYLLASTRLSFETQDRYEVLAGAVVAKTETHIVATPGVVIADGVSETSVTVTPFVACTLVTNGTAEAIAVGDPLILTSDTPTTFRIVFQSMPGYWAEDVQVAAVDFGMAVSSGVSVGESRTVFVPRLRPTPSEPLTLTETVTLRLPTLRLALLEAVAVGDSASTAPSARLVLDGLMLGESVQVRFPMDVQRGDSLTLGDPVTVRLAPVAVGVQEAVSLSDSVGQRMPLVRRAVSEPVGVSEQTGLVLVTGI